MYTCLRCLAEKWWYLLMLCIFLFKNVIRIQPSVREAQCHRVCQHVTSMILTTLMMSTIFTTASVCCWCIGDCDVSTLRFLLRYVFVDVVVRHYVAVWPIFLFYRMCMLLIPICWLRNYVSTVWFFFTYPIVICIVSNIDTFTRVPVCGSLTLYPVEFFFFFSFDRCDRFVSFSVFS